MKKCIASAVAIVSLLALMGCNTEEKQPQKPSPQFGVVEINKLYQESKLGKAGVARVGEIETKAMEVLKGIQGKLEQANKDGKEADAKKLEQELQAHLYFYQNLIKQDQEHVMNVMQTALTKAFKKYSDEHGLFGVFSSDTMLSSSPEVDVTAGVLAIIDQDAADFGALPSMEMPPLPEPANAEPEAPAAPAEAAPAEVPAK